jgi:hypothetical protein
MAKTWIVGVKIYSWIMKSDTGGYDPGEIFAFSARNFLVVMSLPEKAPTIMPVSWPLVKVEAAGAGVVVVVDVGEAVGELDPLQHPLWQP